MKRWRHSSLTALLAAALALVLAAQAPAASHNPKGEYARFSECPLSIATLTDCVYFRSTGGSFTVGTMQLELFKALTLQGGFSGAGEEIKFYGAEDGNTLSESEQPLPGLLVGNTPSWWPSFLQQWFNEGVKKEGHTGVIATIELVGPSEGLTDIELSTENLLAEKGIALGLPVRIKLTNDLLGNCHVGSASAPLKLKLTTGRSGSLKGSVGTLSYNQANTLSTLTGGRLVDGTYTAPRASGCGGLLSPFLDPLVDSIFGLPSSAGKNTAILAGEFLDGQVESVRASE